MKKGLLIVFCGIDGSGKSTQARILIDRIKHNGMEVSYVYNRWDQYLLRSATKLWTKSIAKKVSKSDKNFDKYKKNKRRKLLSNPLIGWLWLIYFFIECGLQLFIKVRLELLKNRLIVSDRIFYDSVIDQAVDLEDKKELIVNSLDSFWVKTFFPDPDMVIYVDCPEEVSFSRKNDIEDIDYLTERRHLYLRLAEKYKWFKVDGTLPVDEISEQIKNEVFVKLGV